MWSILKVLCQLIKKLNIGTRSKPDPEFHDFVLATSPIAQVPPSPLRRLLERKGVRVGEGESA